MRPRGKEVGPQQLVIEVAQQRQADDAGIEKRAEKRREEHHFRKDEPAHSPTERDVDLAVVVAVLGFARHDRKPADQHVDQRGEPDRQRKPAERIVVDHHGRAEHRKNHGDTADRRPLRRRRHVVKRAMRRRVGVRGAMRVSHRFVPSFDQRTTKLTITISKPTNSAAATRPAMMTYTGLSWAASFS